MGVNFQWSKEEDGGSENDGNLIKNYDLEVLTFNQSSGEMTVDNAEKEQLKIVKKDFGNSLKLKEEYFLVINPDTSATSQSPGRKLTVKFGAI